MKNTCIYSIIRYMPFADKEEFANIGVILCCPKLNLIKYKLSHKNHKRIKDFFRDNLLYKNVINYYMEDISAFSRNVDLKKYHVNDHQFAAIFKEYISKKEASIQYSNMRNLVTEDIDRTVNELFDRLVNGSDITEQYIEDRLNTKLKNEFKKYDHLKYAFKSKTVGNELIKFKLPFVIQEDDFILSAIKPLAFEQSEVSKMIEHCDIWISRLERASNDNILDLKNTLIPIYMHNTQKNRIKEKAKTEIQSTMHKLGVKTVDYSDKSQIINFANAQYNNSLKI